MLNGSYNNHVYLNTTSQFADDKLFRLILFSKYLRQICETNPKRHSEFTFHALKCHADHTFLDL